MNSKYVKNLTTYVTLALIIASVFAGLGLVTKPVEAQAYTVLSLTSSKPTIYNNTLFYIRVDIWTTGTPPDNITLAMYASSVGYMYQVNATRIGNTLSYRANFTIVDKELKYCKGTCTSFTPAIYLDVNDYIEFYVGDKTLKLVYTPTEPKVTPNVNEIITPTTLRDLKDWIIEAPDLNADPETAETLQYVISNVPIRYIVADVYVGTSYKSTIKVYASETGKNTGIFKVTSSDPLPDIAAGNTVTFKFYIPKDPGSDAYNWTVTVQLPVVAPPPISIATDRDEIPLSVVPLISHVNVSLGITITDTSLQGAPTYAPGASTLTTGEFNVTVYNISGKPAKIIPKLVGSVYSVDTGVYKAWVEINTSQLKPDYINGWVKITYNASDKKLYTKTLPLKTYPAGLYVNDSNVVEAKYGDVVILKLVDMEWNLNASKKDRATITVGSYTFYLDETGPNTGVFTGKITVAGVTNGGGNVTISPGASLTIPYVDQRSPLTTPDMKSFLTDSYSVKIVAKTFIASVTTDKTTYGPWDTVKITVKDPDRNQNLTKAESVTILIRKPDGDFYKATATETGKNTGVFVADVPLSALGSAEDVLLMRETTIIFRDDISPEGVSLVQTKITVVSWDGIIATDKNAYNLGEKIKINVTDPDANTTTGIDMIKVKVTSTTDPVGVYVTLVETGPNTGVFTGEVLVSDTNIETGYILAHLGDEITITYVDPYPANYAGKSATFTKVVRVGVPVEKPIVPSEARFVDPFTGQPVTPTVGKTVGIDVTLSNTGPVKTSFTVLLIVRDATGAAVSILWQRVTLSPGDVGGAGFTFTLTAAGDYTIEVYVIKSLADWTPMGTALTATLTVS